MNEMLDILAVALGPVIFLFTWIYMRDKNNKEPLVGLGITFVLGCLTVVPAYYIEVYLGEQFRFYRSGNATGALINAFVIAAATEECLKYTALRIYAYPRKFFDEPYDGIMYAVAASLGFAAVENLLYVMQFGMGTGYLRMFTAVPGHAMFGVLMGYYVGKAKFRQGYGEGFFDHAIGLLLAITVHGLYDFFLFWQVEYVAFLTFAVLILAFLLSSKAIRIHRHRQI